MPKNTDDLCIRKLEKLMPPSHLVRESPCSDTISDLIYQSRDAMHRILHGMDDHLIVIIGPCSIHDTKAAMDYARRLVEQRERFKNKLEIVMHVYFEKPRTAAGWKGLINDPRINGSFRTDDGLRTACELLMSISELDLPADTEYLNVISPQYIADLVSWGTVGAHTTESQMHRGLTSGLSCPIGFKSGTDDNVKIAVDATKIISQPHHFLSVTKGSHSAIMSTAGSENCHIILHDGKALDHDTVSVQRACDVISKSSLAARLVIDASHADSGEKYENQIPVCEDIGYQMAASDDRIVGVMVGSHINAGRQDHVQDTSVSNLIYGQSVTGACIGWDDPVRVLETLAGVVRKRHLVPGSGN